jgi:hypothetical protein
MRHCRFERTRAVRIGKFIRGSTASLPLAAFRNHDQEMKNWKGVAAAANALALGVNAQLVIS